MSFITRSGFFILSFFIPYLCTLKSFPYVFLFCVVYSLFNFYPCLLIHFLESFHLLPSCFHSFSFLYIFVFFFTCSLPSFLPSCFISLSFSSLPFLTLNSPQILFLVRSVILIVTFVIFHFLSFSFSLI